MRLKKRDTMEVGDRFRARLDQIHPDPGGTFEFRNRATTFVQSNFPLCLPGAPDTLSVEWGPSE